MKNIKKLDPVLLGSIIGSVLFVVVGVSVYFGFLPSVRNTRVETINSFEECAMKYPVMESYPERCATPDGRSFTKEYPPVNTDPDTGNQSSKTNPQPSKPGSGTVPEPVFCTMDAMQCPDGSYVGRTGPNCEFVCPGN